MIDKVQYEIAKASGTLDLLRGDEISRLVRKRYTLGAETRMVCNLLREPNNAEYLAEFEEHELYVEECKAMVDALFTKFREEIGEEIC